MFHNYLMAQKIILIICILHAFFLNKNYRKTHRGAMSTPSRHTSLVTAPSSGLSAPCRWRDVRWGIARPWTIGSCRSHWSQGAVMGRFWVDVPTSANQPKSLEPCFWSRFPMGVTRLNSWQKWMKMGSWRIFWLETDGVCQPSDINRRTPRSCNQAMCMVLGYSMSIYIYIQ